MFAVKPESVVAPKQTESSMVPRRGRKNKEIALENLEKAIEKIDQLNLSAEASLKAQELSPADLRKNLKNMAREVKDVKKFLSKYKNAQYKPKRTRECHSTGLEKLRPISESMSLFASDIGLVDWKYGETEKSRYEITIVLCKYVKENDLRDPDNKTIIKPDARLKELLQIEDDVVLKYPTMQKYLKNCFDKVEEQPLEKVVEEKVVVEDKGVEKPLKEKKTSTKKEKVSKK
jgi:hypothetical protein